MATILTPTEALPWFLKYLKGRNISFEAVGAVSSFLTVYGFLPPELEAYVTDLEEFLQECNTAYFVKGAAPISEFQYDWYKDRLQEMRPTSPILEQVGHLMEDEDG